ncbi:MAG: polysaccharide biosynthesis protein [Spirochaetota bacterium]
MNDALLKKVLRRDGSLFTADIARHRTEISNAVENARVLVIGAAGSIGASFVRQILPFAPRALHLVDISENNLVEVVRDVRSSSTPVPDDLKTFAVAMGSDEFHHLLRSEKPYDYTVNFSALKHVRSEKDPFTLMRMYNTNVLAVKRLLDAVPKRSMRKHFSVSSDKAANPASVMGATKVFMERLLLSYADRIPFSTARFANVAFSDGSLLHGFLVRLRKMQPLSAPFDVKRYFISEQEAGELCLLSCFLGKNREIFFPKLSEHDDMYTFSQIAAEVLAFHGYTPLACSSEVEARSRMTERSPSDKRWPCYFFESDTMGEKPFEEFHTADDIIDMDRFTSTGIIVRAEHRDDGVKKAMDSFERIRKKNLWSLDEMITAIRIAVPELSREEKRMNLDQKM